MIRVLTALALAAVVATPAFAQTGKPSLMNPASLAEKAPATYKAKFDTSGGVVIITVTRAWAPLAADRFYNLVKAGFYDNQRFFRLGNVAHLSFNVVSANSASTSPAIQNLAIILDSVQPIASK